MVIFSEIKPYIFLGKKNGKLPPKAILALICRQTREPVLRKKEQIRPVNIAVRLMVSGKTPIRRVAICILPITGQHRLVSQVNPVVTIQVRWKRPGD
jgi:hypothetical protein